MKANGQLLDQKGCRKKLPEAMAGGHIYFPTKASSSVYFTKWREINSSLTTDIRCPALTVDVRPSLDRISLPFGSERKFRYGTA